MLKNLRFPFFVALLGLTLFASQARAQVDQQQTVNSAVATIERLKTAPNFSADFNSRLPNAKAVLIVPAFYKGGFIIGAQFGNGVLLARLSGGGFSAPAFYAVSGGSLGLQIGLQDISVAFLIMTDRGYQALLSNKFKIGADAGLTFAVWGAGMGGASTGALGADIVAFAFGGVGLYGGVAFEGAAVTPRDSWNTAYYGGNLQPDAILNQGAANNPGADRLREILAR